MAVPTLHSPGRRLVTALITMGAVIVVVGLILALGQSTAPYTTAGAVIVMGMFVAGIGIGGLLFTPRVAPTDSHDAPEVRPRH